jgi:hypothetical protein
MPRDNTPSTSEDEHTQHCLEILADANESVQAHIAFFAQHTEDFLFSPNASGSSGNISLSNFKSPWLR